MKRIRVAAATVACALVFMSVTGSLMPRFDYSTQDREHVDSGPFLRTLAGHR